MRSSILTGLAHPREYAHRESALLELVDVTNDTRADRETGRGPKRLHDPPAEELGDGAGAGDAKGAHDEEREADEVDGAAAVWSARVRG